MYTVFILYVYLCLHVFLHTFMRSFRNNEYKNWSGLRDQNPESLIPEPCTYVRGIFVKICAYCICLLNCNAEAFLLLVAKSASQFAIHCLQFSMVISHWHQKQHSLRANALFPKQEFHFIRGNRREKVISRFFRIYKKILFRFVSKSGLPDFSLYNTPKWGKYTKLPQNGHKIYHMAVK
jgi:hypothetical protein